MNTAVYLERAGRTFGERTAIAVGDKRHSDFAGLAGRVAKIAGGLRDCLGLAPGDRLALVMKNSPEFIEILYAAWHAGLCAVPVNAKLHPREIAYILDHSGARCCVVTPDLMEAVAPLVDEVPGLERVIGAGTGEHRALLACDPLPLAARRPDDTAWLFYTSGTTGRSKGAMLSHRVLQAMTLSYFADVDAVSGRDCILHAAPMSHGSGLYILPHMAMAAKQVIPESGGFDPEEIFRLLPAHEGMTLFAAPTMVTRLVHSPGLGAADLRNLKTIVYGGGPMYVEDLRLALERIGNKFVQIYGQGESPMTITVLSKERHADTGHPRYSERIASVGVPHTVVEVRAADGEDNPLPPGEAGEILVRGDSVMQGYWNNPEATAAGLRGGWLHTGDVGAFDEDGFLTLMDRSKDLIISGGSNIYPREVEEVLLLHEGVLEASVVGRPHPEWGEEVVAFVVAKPGGRADEKELDALCLGNIARFKRPRTYLFIESLPKNNYGKVLKTELRERLRKDGAKD